jgi:hypothetical protein
MDMGLFENLGLALKNSVGNMMHNDEDDVTRVKNALHETGYSAKPAQNGIIDQETDDTIRKFQREKGLKVDGYLMPGGETEKSINESILEKNLNKIDLDEDGASEFGAFISDPVNAVKALLIKSKVEKDVDSEFPNISHYNNEADAFRHALWSYRVTKSMGEKTARAFGEAHERKNMKKDSQPKGQLLMDLQNGEVGIELAKGNKNSKESDIAVIKKAISEHRLRTSPVVTDDDRAQQSLWGNRNGLTATGNLYDGKK